MRTTRQEELGKRLVAMMRSGEERREELNTWELANINSGVKDIIEEVKKEGSSSIDDQGIKDIGEGGTVAEKRMNIMQDGELGRPLSVPFQFRTSGKGTDTATPLGVEKYGRINFSLGKWVSTDPKTPKSIKVHARAPWELARTFFRSLTLSQESLFQRSPSVCRKKY